MKYIFSVVTIVGSVIGAILLLVAMTATDSAPQQGALAATAVGFAVIPYCITRSIQIIGGDDKENFLRGIQNVLFEIRKEMAQSQPDISASRSIRETITRPASSSKRETITHPAREMTPQRFVKALDIMSGAFLFTK